MNDEQTDYILDRLNLLVLAAKNEVLNDTLEQFPDLDQEEVVELIQDYMNEIEF